MQSKPPRKGSQKVTVFREVNNTPSKFRGKLCPSNLQEEKEKFLRFGITPHFNLKETSSDLDKATRKKRGQICFELLAEAKAILDMVKKKYGDESCYMDAAYGKEIDQAEATEALMQYINENNVNGEIIIYWTPDLTASAKMMWHGPSVRVSKPEARKYTLIIKNSSENKMMRSTGIQCLADHEIGTHFFRMVNDGLQPWFSDRKKFGLRAVKTREHAGSEEGLASLNTLINAKSKYLFRPALLYYTACMSANMSFKEVYDHLAIYVKDKDTRWRLVMRVKRGLQDPGKHGGYGNDQCYFEGAVDILQHMDKIDFKVLFSGKVCVDEVNRVHRLTRRECIRLPTFLDNIEKYKKKLRYIAKLNKILPKPDEKVSPPHTQSAMDSSIVRLSQLSTRNASSSSNLTDLASRRQLSQKKSSPSPSNDKFKKKSTQKLGRKFPQTRISPDVLKTESTGSPSSENISARKVINSRNVSVESIEDLNLQSPYYIQCSKEGRLLQRPQSSTNKLK